MPLIPSLRSFATTMSYHSMTRSRAALRSSAPVISLQSLASPSSSFSSIEATRIHPKPIYPDYVAAIAALVIAALGGTYYSTESRTKLGELNEDIYRTMLQISEKKKQIDAVIKRLEFLANAPCVSAEDKSFIETYSALESDIQNKVELYNAQKEYATNGFLSTLRKSIDSSKKMLEKMKPQAEKVKTRIQACLYERQKRLLDAADRENIKGRNEELQKLKEQLNQQIAAYYAYELKLNKPSISIFENPRLAAAINSIMPNVELILDISIAHSGSAAVASTYAKCSSVAALLSAAIDSNVIGESNSVVSDFLSAIQDNLKDHVESKLSLRGKIIWHQLKQVYRLLQMLREDPPSDKPLA